MLGVLAALAALAGRPPALAAQTLTPVGAPVRLAGAYTVVESPLDGSFEFATLQAGPIIPFQGDTSQTEAIHFGSDGQASPGVDPSQMLGSGVSQIEPAAIGLQQGGFVVAWVNAPASGFPLDFAGRRPVASRPLPQTAGDLNTVSARLLDGSGQPVGAEIQVSPDGMAAGRVSLAALSSGGFVASWLQDSSLAFANPGLVARMFSASGEALTGPIAVGAAGLNRGLVGLGDGGFIAAWGAPDGAGIFWQRFNAAGTALAPAVKAVDFDRGGPVYLAANPTGQVALGWMTTDPFSQPVTSVLVQLYNADGSALAPPINVATSTYPSMFTRYPLLSGLAINLRGQALVAWDESITPGQFGNASAFVQLIDATGTVAGTPVQIGTSTAGPQLAAGLVAENDGDWTVVWTNLTDAFAQKLGSAGCSPSAFSLCLDRNRFRVDLQFSNPRTGGAGIGNPVPLSADAGALWFFDQAIPELFVKVIDGTAVNGHFWVFFASLTDLEFDLTVTDTETGARRAYHNPEGTLASQADTAFPLSAAARRGARAAGRPADAIPAAALPAARAGTTPQAAAAQAVCNSTEQALCLLGSEFAVTVTFRETAGSQPATGQAVQLSADGGYYWFFGPNEPELAVKILDGRAVNGHIWVFYASLTNVEFDLTVTDSFSATHASHTYHNPAGTLASAADTGSF